MGVGTLRELRGPFPGAERKWAVQPGFGGRQEFVRSDRKSSDGVLVSQGCHSKLSPTGWLKNSKNPFSPRSGRQKWEIKVWGGPASAGCPHP